MADLPILFSAPMVRAILREIEQTGTGKTQTRRVLDMPPMAIDAVFNDDGVWYVGDAATGHHYAKLPVRYCVADRLYIREAWRTAVHLDQFAPKVLPIDTPIFFEADAGGEAVGATGKFRQGMHMPRWASRITLIVTDVRVQRLQEITWQDAKAEGISGGYHQSEFAALWDSLNDKADRPGCAWRDNPWVAAYTFRPILGNIDQVRP